MNLNYVIEINFFDDDGVFHSFTTKFKSVDLAVSHLLSAMDLGYTVVFKQDIAPDEKN